MKEAKEQNIVKLENIIEANCKEIVLLVCPVMEYKWIPDWKCELVHFPNGLMETGNIFYEFMSAPFLVGDIGCKTKWTCLLFDSENGKVHFKLDNKVSSSSYKFEMIPINEYKTKCTYEFNYIPLNKKGESFIKNGGKGKIQILIGGLSKMLKTYCETAELYQSDKSKQKEVLSAYFTKLELIKLILNKVLMSLWHDRTRKQFFKGESIYKSML